MTLQKRTRAAQSCQVLYTLSARSRTSFADSDEPHQSRSCRRHYRPFPTHVFDILPEEKQSIPLTLPCSKANSSNSIAFAALGRGRDHAKWAPAAAAVGFRATLAKLRPQEAKEGRAFCSDSGSFNNLRRLVAIDAKLFGKEQEDAPTLQSRS